MSHRDRRRRLATRAGVLLAGLPLLAAAACGGGSGGKSSDGDASEQAGPVSIDWWGWAPGYDKVAGKWNATHPNIKVNFQKTEGGAKGGYNKMLAAVKAGNAPCLAQVGYETLASFGVEGALQDVTQYVDPVKSRFQPWTISQATFDGKIFAVPVDAGPMALYYRTDVFEKHKIDVPKTWDEFATAAAELKKADPKAYLTTFDNADSYTFAALASQAGAKWFQTTGDAWKVTVNDPATTKVAQYWQDLIDKKLAKTESAFTPEWFKDLQDGNVAAYVGASWASTLIAESAAKSKGKWAVAPMPLWDPSKPVTANTGGSPNAVLKGCKNPKEAVEFATWLATDHDAFDGLIKDAGLFPTTTDGGTLPALNAAQDFFGGQKIYSVFAESAKTVDNSWQWGPTMNQANADFGDLFGKATSGTGMTFADALKQLQDKTVQQIKSKGINTTS